VVKNTRAFVTKTRKHFGIKREVVFTQILRKNILVEISED
jgi:hypothetical protein